MSTTTAGTLIEGPKFRVAEMERRRETWNDDYVVEISPSGSGVGPSTCHSASLARSDKPAAMRLGAEMSLKANLSRARSERRRPRSDSILNRES